MSRILEIAHELQAMNYHGVHLRRLGRIALDIMVSKASVGGLVEREGPRGEWARHAMRYLERLEAQVVQLHSAYVANLKAARGARRGLVLLGGR